MARPSDDDDDALTFRRAPAAITGKNANKRRTTVYFSIEVARALADYCRRHPGEVMSDVVDRAVAEFLKRRGSK